VSPRLLPPPPPSPPLPPTPPTPLPAAASGGDVDAEEPDDEDVAPDEEDA